MTRTTLVTLAAGLLALVLGRALMFFAPAPTNVPFDYWLLPDALRAVGGETFSTLALQVPGAPASRVQVVLGGGKTYTYSRFHYEVSHIGEDLVPWFAELHDGHWIRLSGRVVGEWPRVNTLVLEHISTNERQALAWTLRVGPYLTPSFTLAKLLQIPAKLQGQGVFEIIVLSSECAADCEAEAQQTGEALASIIAHNLH